MTSIAAPWTEGWRRTLRDPALFATVLVLWALLALFVLFPLVRLSAWTFVDGGHFTLANLQTIFQDPNHRQAFWNSLLLAALVGAIVIAAREGGGEAEAKAGSPPTSAAGGGKGDAA